MSKIPDQIIARYLCNGSYTYCDVDHLLSLKAAGGGDHGSLYNQEKESSIKQLGARHALPGDMSLEAGYQLEWQLPLRNCTS